MCYKYVNMNGNIKIRKSDLLYVMIFTDLRYRYKYVFMVGKMKTVK